MAMNLKVRKALLFAIIVMVFIYSFGGCKEKTSWTTQTATPEVVSLCVGGAPGMFPLLTHEQGFFAAEGVAVNLKKFRTTTEGLEHFFNGECDMSSISETAVVMKSLERQDFSILATCATSDNSAHILANRKSGISTPQDLKGKRILVPKWSSNHYFLYMFLAKYGMSERDVTLVVSDVPNIPSAFAAGDIDACCASGVAIDKARRALGENAVVFDAPGLCISSYHLAARNNLIKAKPGLIRKVLAAMLRNEGWIKANRAAAVKAAAASQNMDEQVMAGVWDEHRWKVELSKTLLISLEQEAQWVINSRRTIKTTIPNYLDFVHVDSLQSLKPEAVTLIK
jgi:NitT/TauT family transport system substrate-binding protein